jgi:hypothetical protein
MGMGMGMGAGGCGCGCGCPTLPAQERSPCGDCIAQERQYAYDEAERGGACARLVSRGASESAGERKWAGVVCRWQLPGAAYTLDRAYLVVVTPQVVLDLGYRAIQSTARSQGLSGQGPSGAREMTQRLLAAAVSMQQPVAKDKD